MMFPQQMPQPQQQFQPQQFIMGIQQFINENTLNELIQRAKLQGISEQDIQAGLKIINQYRK